MNAWRAKSLQSRQFQEEEKESKSYCISLKEIPTEMAEHNTEMNELKKKQYAEMREWRKVFCKLFSRKRKHLNRVTNIQSVRWQELRWEKSAFAKVCR